MERFIGIRSISRKICKKYALVTMLLAFSGLANAQQGSTTPSSVPIVTNDTINSVQPSITGNLEKNTTKPKEIVQMPKAIELRSIVLLPKQGEIDIKPGMILEIGYENQHDDLIINWQDFVGKRISPVMFLLSVKKSEIIEVLITDVEKKTENIEINDEKIAVKMMGFKYIPGKSNNENFIFETINLIESKTKEYIVFTILILFLMSGLGYFATTWIKKKTMERERNDIKKQLVSRVVYAKKREDFEKTYLKRDDYEGYGLGNEDLESFLIAINRIQFKATWSNEELENISNLAKAVEKKWINDGI